MNKEPIVLGTLKKEKSSKPIFVLITFILLVGTLFTLPYVTSLLGDDYELIYLLGGSKSEESTVIDTTTKLVCSLNNSSITYSFKDNKLLSIKHTFSYTNVGNELDETYLNDYTNMKDSLVKLNIDASIKNINNGFTYYAYIESAGDYTVYNDTYYKLNTNYSSVKSSIENKGYECK